jgi:hypothetical protein
MTLDCYEFYLWSIGELHLPAELTQEILHQHFKRENE